MYETLVALHVVAAIAGFGATFTYPVVERAAGLEVAADVVLAISRWLAVPMTSLVGVTGAVLVATGPYALTDAWVAVSIGLYLAVMAIGIGVLAPAYARARRASSRVEQRAALRPVRTLGPPVAAAIVAVAVLMEAKPG